MCLNLISAQSIHTHTHSLVLCVCQCVPIAFHTKCKSARTPTHIHPWNVTIFDWSKLDRANPSRVRPAKVREGKRHAGTAASRPRDSVRRSKLAPFKHRAAHTHWQSDCYCLWHKFFVTSAIGQCKQSNTTTTERIKSGKSN